MDRPTARVSPVSWLPAAATNHMMDRNVIAVLPPIPLCMTLKTVLTLLSINMSIDSLTGLNFFLTRFHLHVKPTLFFQERVDGGLYGKLPHSKMSLEIVDPTITHEIFPYITFSNSEISSRLDAYEYSVRIQQGYSVNIVVLVTRCTFQLNNYDR